MTAESVRVEWRDESVVVVTLDRPERRNAVDHATLEALLAAQRAAVERRARVFVLTGAPPAFCAGADLTGVEDGAFVATLVEVLRGFGAMPVACIAAIDGPALGAGTQLALACDVRVATAGSRFGIPAAKLGLAVDAWTVERLAQLAGASVARAMLLTATTYDAPSLVPGGFVHRLGDLDVALAWADEIAHLAPLTIAAHKAALEHGAPDGRPDDRVDAARVAAWRSNDAAEGRSAFLEKRPPNFTGT